MEIINSNNNFTFEYSEYNRKYYVCDQLGYNVTTLKLSFDEAKELFDSLNFCDVSCLDYDFEAITQVIRKSRKEKVDNFELNNRFMDLFIN